MMNVPRYHEIIVRINSVIWKNKTKNIKEN